MDNQYYDVNIICIHHKIQIKACISLKDRVFRSREGLRGSFPFPSITNSRAQSNKVPLETETGLYQTVSKSWTASFKKYK